VNLQAEKAQEFEKGIYLNNSIIRHLLVVGSDEVEEVKTSEEN
jgi:ribosomal protein S6